MDACAEQARLGRLPLDGIELEDPPDAGGQIGYRVAESTREGDGVGAGRSATSGDVLLGDWNAHKVSLRLGDRGPNWLARYVGKLDASCRGEALSNRFRQVSTGGFPAHKSDYQDLVGFFLH